MHKRYASVPVILFLLSCNPSFDVDPTIQVTCNSNEDCPSDMVCQTSIGLCIHPQDLQISAPGVVSGSAVISPQIVGMGQLLTVVLEVSAALAQAPVITANNDDTTIQLNLSSQADPVYEFSYRFSSSDPEGIYTIRADLIGSLGAINLGIELGTITYDSTGPTIISSYVSYIPGVVNPLASEQLQAATGGTEIHIEINASEALGLSHLQSLSLADAASELVFTAIDANSDTAVIFNALVNENISQGDHATIVKLVDRAGNMEQNLSGPTIRIQHTAPTLHVDQDHVILVRSPWGNASPESLGNFTLPAGPYFEIAPINTLSDDIILPASTFTFSPSQSIAMIQVWSSSKAIGLLAELTPDSNSDWPRTYLGGDAATVWVTGVDYAGNSSEPVQLQNIEWVTTLNGTVGDLGPHAMWVQPLAKPVLRQTASRRIADDSNVAGLDGIIQQADFEVAFELTTTSTLKPSARTEHAMAYDATRGVIVLYGGRTNASSLDEVWEWDGKWIQRPTQGTNPGSRYGHNMVFDSARGRMLVFGGGNTSVPLNDLWEWDGSVWYPRFTQGEKPEPRIFAAMTYLEIDGQALLMGGMDSDGNYLKDTWLWDGTEWTEVSTPTDMQPRAEHAMTYDPVNNMVIMHGGENESGLLSDTWFWSGSWAEYNGSDSPLPRKAHKMIYDYDYGQVLMAGGVLENSVGDPDTYLWDGTNWHAQPIDVGGAIFRTWHAGLAHHNLRKLSIFFGGQEPEFLDDSEIHRINNTWEYISLPSSTWPGDVRGAAMACYTAGGFCLVGGGQYEFGGSTYTSTGYFWDYHEWTSMSSNALYRRDGEMVYDPSGERFFIYGGYTYPGNGLWEWDETNGWQDHSALSTNPGARTGPGVAWDKDRNRLVVFGGTTNNQVWEYNGSVWQNRTPASGSQPDARSFPAMAYDEERQVVVMFGGISGSLYYDDLWYWDGDANPPWTQVTHVSGRAWPEARQDHNMIYDPNRKRIVLFGGASGSYPYTYYDDIWEWDGVAWQERTVVGNPPSPRSGAAMAFDENQNKLLIFGGNTGQGTLVQPYSYDMWQADFDPSGTPALQVNIDLSAGGFDLELLQSIRIRTVCGAEWSPYENGDTGAQVAIWKTFGDSATPRWQTIDENTQDLSLSNNDMTNWRTGGIVGGREYVQSATKNISIQCRMHPDRDSSDGSVGMDYLEIRARYQTF